jgi:hypothetical protein
VDWVDPLQLALAPPLDDFEEILTNGLQLRESTRVDLW